MIASLDLVKKLVRLFHALLKMMRYNVLIRTGL